MNAKVLYKYLMKIEILQYLRAKILKNLFSEKRRDQKKLLIESGLIPTAAIFDNNY
jgi:hypothetical protein